MMCKILIFFSKNDFFSSMPSLSPLKIKMLLCSFYHKLNTIRNLIVHRATSNLKIRSISSHKVFYSTKQSKYYNFFHVILMISIDLWNNIMTRKQKIHTKKIIFHYFKSQRINIIYQIVYFMISSKTKYGVQNILVLILCFHQSLSF